MNLLISLNTFIDIIFKTPSFYHIFKYFTLGSFFPFYKFKLLSLRNFLNYRSEYITMVTFNKNTYLLNDKIVCNRGKMTVRNMSMEFRKLSLVLLILSKVTLFNVKTHEKC